MQIRVTKLFDGTCHVTVIPPKGMWGPPRQASGVAPADVGAVATKLAEEVRQAARNEALQQAQE